MRCVEVVKCSKCLSAFEAQKDPLDLMLHRNLAIMSPDWEIITAICHQGRYETRVYRCLCGY